MLISILLTAFAAGPDSVEATISNQAWCFASGLRVIFEPDATRDEVYVHTIVDGGSAGEEPGTEGVAHLVEHLWFQARPGGGQPVFTRIAAMGARHGAFTTQDRIEFHTRAPRGVVKQLLQLEAARFDETLMGVDAKVLDVERNIVRNELQWRFGDNGAGVWDPLYQAMFPAPHPYQRLPAGTAESLDALTLDHAGAYAKKWFRPEHTTVAVSGAVDPDTFADLLGQTLPAHLLQDDAGNIVAPCRMRARPVPLPDSTPRPTPIRWDAPSASRQAVAGWALPPEMASLAAYDLWLIEYFMADKLERGVSCQVAPNKHAAIATCSFRLGPDEDAQKLLRQGLTAAAVVFEANERQALTNHYNRYVQNSRAALLRSLERAGGERAASHYHETGEQDWVDGIVRRLEVKDFSEAARLAQQSLTAKRAHVVVIEPTADDPAGIPEAHASRAADSAEAVDPRLVTPMFLDGIVGEPDWLKARTFPLKPGITLTVLPHGNLGIARAALVFPGGWRNEPKPLIDSVAWASMPEVDSAGWESARTLLGTWSEARWPNAWVYTLSGADIDRQFAALLAHYDTQTPSADTARTIRKMSPVVLTTHGLATDARDARLLPDLPVTPAEVQAAVSAFTPKELKDYARTQLRPDGAHLIVVGNVDPDQVAAKARLAFARLKPTGVARAPASDASVAPPAPAVIAFEDPVPRAQTSVRLSCRLAEGGPTAQIVATTVASILGDQLREQAGLTYGVNAWNSIDEGGPRLEISTSVQKDGTAKAITALRDGVRALATTGPDARTLAAARVTAAVTYADRLQVPDQILGQVISRTLSGEMQEPGTGKALAAVDANAVKAALATCAEHEVITAVGSSIGEPLSAAGLLTEPVVPAAGAAPQGP